MEIEMKEGNKNYLIWNDPINALYHENFLNIIA
jgi:hypothetical protein